MAAPNPYAPPRAETPQRPVATSLARVHRAINVVLLATLLACALFIVLGCLVELSRGQSIAARDGSWGIPIAVLTACATTILGCSLSLFGLLTRRPWAAQVTRAYWVVSMLTVVLIPVAIYGIVSTTRRSFREMFEGGTGA
jgi:hypothetical protein